MSIWLNYAYYDSVIVSINKPLQIIIIYRYIVYLDA